ncbi:hypothetical protein D3C71_1852080 [compost metagenome]
MMADRHEYAAGRDYFFLARLIVQHLQASHAVVARQHFERCAVQRPFHLGVVADTVLHDLGCAELIAAVNQRHL